MTVYDLRAEESLLGAMLLRPEAIAAAVPVVGPGDFYKPAHGALFAALADQWGRGQHPDPTTVAPALDETTLGELGGPAQLVTLQAGCPATSNAGAYARQVAETAGWRKLIAAGAEIVDLGRDHRGDVGDALERALGLVAMIETPTGAPKGLVRVAEMGADPTPPAPWVVPGLLRADWRVLFVAPEGAGKSTLLRTIATAAAAGVHPFARTPIVPVRALVVDAENPRAAVDEGFRLVTDRLPEAGDPDRLWLWHRPGGINVRSRVDRAALDAACAHVRPDLVCLGPLYKTYRRKPGEDHEIAAEECQAVLDDLRTRHGFALVIEHHAPKATGGKRDLDPYGSQRWQAWPEFGFKLIPQDDEARVLKLGRFRLDRLPASWPERLERAADWPWRGVWPTGTFHREEPF